MTSRGFAQWPARVAVASVVAHSVVAAEDARTPGPQTCTQRVCAIDPYCCEVTWDAVCDAIAAKECACPADLDGNRLVDGTDLGLLVNAWGTVDPLADLDADGTVGGADLALLLGSFGACGIDDACRLEVCSIDPYCCEVAWDVLCEAAAAQVCGG
jgi:hypothetical protein